MPYLQGSLPYFTLLHNTKSSGAITRLATMGFPMTHNSMWVLYYRVRAFSTSARQSQDTVIYLLSKTHWNKAKMADSRYTCSLCPKAFKQRYHLNRQMLNHQLAKYPCRMCNKRFHRTDLLSKHEGKCSLSVDHKTCELCSRSFSQKCSMTRHKKICVIRQTARNVKQSTAQYWQEVGKRGNVRKRSEKKYRYKRRSIK